MAQNFRTVLKQQLAAAGKGFFRERPYLLYVFFSFDLVDSTLYKNNQKEIWPTVFSHFYTLVRKGMKQKFRGINVWKYIGDEVLFFKELNSKEDLFDVIPGSQEVLTSTLKHLNDVYKENLKPLSLKGTIWCAPVTEARGVELRIPQDEKPRNFSIDNVYEDFDTPYEKSTSRKDFIGPDIDIGFRISKYAEKEKVVASADLAYMVLKSKPPVGIDKNRLTENLKIVSYEDLKGIWNDRYYPIIWYYKDWKNIKESFAYDDRFKSEIIDNVYLNQFDDIKYLLKIFKQLSIIAEKNELLEILEESEKIAKKRAKKKPPKRIPVIIPTSDECR